MQSSHKASSTFTRILQEMAPFLLVKESGRRCGAATLDVRLCNVSLIRSTSLSGGESLFIFPFSSDLFAFTDERMNVLAYPVGKAAVCSFPLTY